jgi:hypothetical protein
MTKLRAIVIRLKTAYKGFKHGLHERIRFFYLKSTAQQQ